MVVAYVFATATTGSVERTRDELALLGGITDVYVVAGDHDLVARVEVGSTAAVRETVVSRMQSIEGVGTTQTYVAMD